MPWNFYRLSSKVRGGGETRSKIKELAEEAKVGVGGPVSSGAEISTILGSTKTIAPVTAGSEEWQDAIVQSNAACRPLCSQPAIGASFAALASPELFFGA